MVAFYKGAVAEQLNRRRDSAWRAWGAVVVAVSSWIPASALYNWDVFGRVTPGVRWLALALVLASVAVHLWLAPKALQRMRRHFDGQTRIFIPAMFFFLSCLLCVSFLVGIVQRLGIT
jgi:membrane protein YdbS with pleckstrin-like domain